MTSGMPSATLGGGMHGHDEPGHRAPGTLGDVLGGGQHQPRRDQPGGTAVGIVTKEIRRSGTSSGESSEEEGHTPTGGRRKKKGLGEKIKDKLMPGGKHKDQEVDHTATTTMATTTTTTIQHHEDEPAEKKGLMDKIKDKLPGHH
ncbi:late embryogenesis abundant protein-like [Chenopodium quinoa]|nr:late embryogenesis abundant protein-like [Chenopodium quinoa]